jgi:hypothetical protein
MRIHRKTGLIPLVLMTAFLLAACGGGGSDGGGTTPLQSPKATTAAASNVTTDNAVLNGVANPNGLATNAWFEWGIDPNLATSATTVSQAVGSGSADNAVAQGISGLTTGTTYYFRLVASNSADTVRGAIVPFTTASPNNPPSVQTLAADNLSITGGTLHGSVTPNGLATTAHFEWGTDNTFSVPNVTPNQAVGSDLASHLIAANLSGLTPGTKYYYRVIASNSAGATTGLTASFTTNTLAPAVNTVAADNVTATGARLNGNVNPNGVATTAHFEWGTDNALASFSTTLTQSVGSSLTPQAFSATLSPGILTAGTTYYFRIVANNSTGESKGAILNFTTLQNPPPTAVAHFNETVYMLGPDGRTDVSMDASESVDPFNGPITAYTWTQTGGTNTPTLSEPGPSLAAVNTSFTVPILEYGTSDNLVYQLTVVSSRGVPGHDTIWKNVLWGYQDDFSTGITGYTVIDNTFSGGGTGTFTAANQMGVVVTGDNTGLLFQHGFGLIDTGGNPVNTQQGTFTMNFSPFGKRDLDGGEGGIEIRLGEDFDTCYLISTIDNTISKRFGGSTIASTGFVGSYPTGDYFIKITFSPGIPPHDLTVEAFGQVFTLDNGQNIPVSTYFISVSEQDASFDDIILQTIN